MTKLMPLVLILTLSACGPPQPLSTGSLPCKLSNTKRLCLDTENLLGAVSLTTGTLDTIDQDERQCTCNVLLTGSEASGTLNATNCTDACPSASETYTYDSTGSVLTLCANGSCESYR